MWRLGVDKMETTSIEDDWKLEVQIVAEVSSRLLVSWLDTKLGSTQLGQAPSEKGLNRFESAFH